MPLENLSKNYNETEGERKNSKVFWSGDFGYTKDKLYKDKLLLKCRFFTKMKCKGRAFIHEDKLQVTTVHSCSLRETDYEVLLAKSTMKKKAEATSEDVRSIFQNTLSEFPSVVSESVSFPQIIPSLQKRRLNESLNPKSPKKAAEVLNDKKCHRYGDIFLGSVAEQDNVALLFGHMLVINKAKSAKVCFVDGTFRYLFVCILIFQSKNYLGDCPLITLTNFWEFLPHSLPLVNNLSNFQRHPPPPPPPPLPLPLPLLLNYINF